MLSRLPVCFGIQALIPAGVQRCDIDLLSDALLRNILGYLEPVDLQHSAAVSKRWFVKQKLVLRFPFNVNCWIGVVWRVGKSSGATWRSIVLLWRGDNSGGSCWVCTSRSSQSERTRKPSLAGG